MPVLLNILLIDSFYLPGTVYYIAVEAIGLICLLLLEYNRLVIFFLKDDLDLPQVHFKSNNWKTVLRSLVIVVTLSLMIFHSYPQYYPSINGRYLVKSLKISGAAQRLPIDDSVLTKVFIDKDDFVLEYNSYKRRFIGSYKYDEAKNQLTAIWRYPRNFHDTLFAHLLPGEKNGLKVLVGRMGKDSLKIGIQKADMTK
jgi:hypothetical protein